MQQYALPTKSQSPRTEEDTNRVMTTVTVSPQAAAFFQALKLSKLSLEQIRRIDAVLASLGEYGEVHLVIKNGELRYINKVESFKAWRDEPETRGFRNEAIMRKRALR